MVIRETETAESQSSWQASRKMATSQALLFTFNTVVPYDQRRCDFNAQRYASVVCAMAAYLSVTSRSSTKTDKHSITQTKPHHSPGNLFFRRQRSPRNYIGVTRSRGTKCRRGYVKIDDFRQIACCISKTIQDSRTVSIKVEQEVVCTQSSGDIAYELQCPEPPPNTPFSAFCTAIDRSVTGAPRDFKFGI